MFVCEFSWLFITEVRYDAIRDQIFKLLLIDLTLYSSLSTKLNGFLEQQIRKGRHCAIAQAKTCDEFIVRGWDECLKATEVFSGDFIIWV